MATISIPLGTREQLEILYSYPNIPGSDESRSINRFAIRG
jgi:hypothetical protein